MFTKLQICIAMAVSKIVYEENFEQYELKEGAENIIWCRRATIKEPTNDDYGNGCALITRKIDDNWYVGMLLFYMQTALDLATIK